MKSAVGRRDFLKFLGAGAAGLAIPGCMSGIKDSSGKSGIDYPNIVFIMADDMGYGDVGCYGAEKIKTPNMDRLAAEGVRFTDAHTPSAVCTPTRYGVLTGRYCWRTKLKKGVLWSGYEALLIDSDRMTVASLLKSKGYATASVGKWHLGFGSEEFKGDWRVMHDGKSGADYSKKLEPGPLALGFDYSFQFPASHDMQPYCFVENGYLVGELSVEKSPYHFQQRPGLMTKDWKDDEIGTKTTEKAVAFIENHTKKKGNQPFFMYLTPVAPHRPNIVADFVKGSSRAGVRGDHVQEFDWTVGEVMKTLDRLGLSDNTLIIATSDNGGQPVGRDGIGENRKIKTTFGHKSCGDLRGYKTNIWDGGHRVPFIARWPGKIKPGTTNNEIICLTDLIATAAAIVGAELPCNAAEDSYNVLPALLGEKLDKPIREATVHHDFYGRFAIRQGQWKLIVPLNDRQKLELYDVEKDISETTDVAGQHVEIVRRLSELLKKYKREGRSRV